LSSSKRGIRTKSLAAEKEEEEEEEEEETLALHPCT